ncbi:Reverse transcriptase-like [Sesbania bispinosa]|nr:Reverse transcriptase-like [Sesbania bispinosa]
MRALETLFLSTIWWLWKRRNNSIFSTDSWSMEFLIRNIYISLDDFDRGALLDVATAVRGPDLWWSPPPFGYTKLNVDGSFHHSTGSMAIGGVLCASNGSRIWGFSAKCGVGSILEPELLALKIRL